MENVILIGMPGCGKSTAGVLLAKRLGFDFLDTDVVIQAHTGKMLQEIIDGDGLDAFLQIEEDELAQVNCIRTVIATGGSAVYGARAMKNLRNIGTIVYIRLSYSKILTRLGNLATRGVAMRPGQTLRQLYNERTKLYEQYADITVDAEQLELEQTVDSIAGAVCR